MVGNAMCRAQILCAGVLTLLRRLLAGRWPLGGGLIGGIFLAGTLLAGCAQPPPPQRDSLDPDEIDAFFLPLICSAWEREAARQALICAGSKVSPENQDPSDFGK